eukprot:658422-Amphidinium_carterae.1
MNVSDALKVSKGLLDSSKLFASSCTSAQLEACHSMLEALESGDKLVTTSSMKPFVSRMAISMEEHIHCEVASATEAKVGEEGSTSDSGKKQLRGMEALQHLLTQYTATPPVQQSELRFFSIFRHKLSAEELTKVTGWRDKLVKATTPSIPSSSSTKPSAKQKAKVAKASEDKKAAVRAALKLAPKASAK